MVCRLSGIIDLVGSQDANKLIGQEKLLLDTHCVGLPAAQQPDPGAICGQKDPTAVAILQLLKPDLLHNHVPLQVSGDGNCLYRALSWGLYGTEEHHMLLRLLTALEIAVHDKLYNPENPELGNMIGDRRIDLPSYKDTLEAVLKPGAYQDIVHMFAASAVIHKPIASHHPSSNEYLSAWTRRVVGRGVKHAATELRILWSSMVVPDTAATFSANHFVVLHPTAQPGKAGGIINLADDDEFPALTMPPRTTSRVTQTQRVSKPLRVSKPPHFIDPTQELDQLETNNEVRSLNLKMKF